VKFFAAGAGCVGVGDGDEETEGDGAGVDDSLLLEHADAIVRTSNTAMSDGRMRTSTFQAPRIGPRRLRSTRVPC
jgi:hypothetical protein